MHRRFQLGDWLPLAIHTIDSDGKAAVADAPVTVKIFDASASLVETVTLPSRPERISDLTARSLQYSDGLVRLDSSYSAGMYMIFYSYTTESTATVRGHYEAFEIVAGGSADGAVIASYFHDLPNANNLVFQLDNGDLRRRLNPR